MVSCLNTSMNISKSNSCMPNTKIRKQDTQRRNEYRLAACLHARVRILGCSVAGVTHDLSASGASIRITSPWKFQVGQRCPIEIYLPAEETPVKAQAEVVRIITPCDSFGRTDVALNFIEIEDEDQARIARFIYRRQIKNRDMGLA